MGWTSGLNLFLTFTVAVFNVCQLQDMMAENEDLLDIEKLARHEFDLDVEEQRQLQSQCEVEVHKVGSYLVWSLLAKRHYQSRCYASVSLYWTVS